MIENSEGQGEKGRGTERGKGIYKTETLELASQRKEECHFTIWNACIQIGGRGFGARRMQLYLHCHIPRLDKGKRHPGKSYCRASELHKS